MKIAVADSMRKQCKGWSKADIVVINNPIDDEVFQDRSARQRTKDFVVVYAGRVHPEKGLDILFEAAEQLALQGATRPVGLKMVGTWDIGRGGGGEDYVKRLERLAPHTKVEWVGEITDPKALATAIGEGDCFAYPSAAAKGETFGVAPLEAMALGLPTILSDLACFSDYAEAGVNSLRIALGENAVAEMREALARVRDDSDAMARMSENAVATAKRFTKERIAAQYIDLFQRSMTEAERRNGRT